MGVYPEYPFNPHSDIIGYANNSVLGELYDAQWSVDKTKEDYPVTGKLTFTVWDRNPIERLPETPFELRILFKNQFDYKKTYRIEGVELGTEEYGVVWKAQPEIMTVHFKAKSFSFLFDEFMEVNIYD
ncbi:hypothetical protein_gp036 [Bacillus phage vB_BceM_WH1]|nr:hypothetical protein_gp036 [Bacillus phage vB_BceM_WH1]